MSRPPVATYAVGMKMWIEIHGLGCPLCYANIRGRSNYKGHKGYKQRKAARRDWRAMALSKSLRQSVASSRVPGTPAAGVAEAFFKTLPLLAAFLTETVWEENEARETATVNVFAEDGYWKLMLKDRDAESVAFVTAETLVGAFQKLEKGLANQSLDWRENKFKDKGAKKRG